MSKVTVQWHGLTAEATVVKGDWEGDPSVPNGVNHLAPYLEDITLSDPDGNDVYDYINADGRGYLTEALLLEAGNEEDMDA